MKFIGGQEQTTCFMLGRTEKVVKGPLVLGEDYLRDETDAAEMQPLPESADLVFKDKDLDLECEQDIRYLLLELLEMLEEEVDATHNDDDDTRAKRDGHSHHPIYDNIVENLYQLFEVCAEVLSGRGICRGSIARAQDRARSGFGWCRGLSSSARKWGRASVLDRWGGGDGGARSK